MTKRERKQQRKFDQKLDEYVRWYYHTSLGKIKKQAEIAKPTHRDQDRDRLNSKPKGMGR